MKHTDQIVHLLFQVDKAIHEQLRDAAEPCPLSLPGLMALQYIDNKEAASISDMAAHFGIRKSSMSTKVSKLERHGLIKRDSCKFDKRSHSITLTKKATDLIQSSKEYVATYAAPLFETLNKKEQQTFIQLLTKILK